MFSTFFCFVGNAQSFSIQWQKSYNLSNKDKTSDIKQTKDGGYIIAGLSNSTPQTPPSPTSGTESFLVIKTDSFGSVIWKRELGGSKSDWANSVQETFDGGYIAVGISASTDGDIINPKGNEDCYVVKFDSLGNIEWQKNFGGSNWDQATSVIQTPDSNFIISGYTSSLDGDLSNIYRNNSSFAAWIFKLNTTGSIIWQRIFDGTSNDYAESIINSENSQLVAVITSYSSDGDFTIGHKGGGSDCYVLKLDSIGNTVWLKSYGGVLNEMSGSIIKCNDNGYLLSCWSQSWDGDIENVPAGVSAGSWVVKIDSLGIIQWQRSFWDYGCSMGVSLCKTFDGGFVTSFNSLYSDTISIGNHGKYDCLVIKLDSLGKINQTICLGGSKNDFGGIIHQTSDTGFIVATTSNSTDGDRIASAVSIDEDIWLVKLNKLGKKQMALPSLDITTFSTTVCRGALVKFKTIVKNVDSIKIFEWYINNINVNVNSSLFSTKNLNNNDTVQCLLITQSGLRLFSNKLIFIVHDSINPIIRINLDTSFACKGTPITCVAIKSYYDSSSTVQWYINNSPLNFNSDTFKNSYFNNNDTVFCILKTNQFCTKTTSVKSNFYVLNIYDTTSAQIIITQSPSSMCKGGLITFNSSITNGGNNPRYEWYLNSKSSGLNPNFTGTFFKDNDTVFCRLVSNAICSKKSDAISNIVITHILDSVMSSIKIFASDTFIFSGTSVTFNSQVVNQGNNPKYEWYVNLQSLNTDKSQISISNVYNNDSIYCILKSNAICLTNNTATSNKIRVQVRGDLGNLIVYPNPTNNFLKIETKENINQIKIYNLPGELVFIAKDINSKNFHPYLGQLSAGIYSMVITLDNNSSITKKIAICK